VIPEPGPGSRVRDKHGHVWGNTEDQSHPGWSNWQIDDSDPESWIYVNQFGPLTLLRVYPMEVDE
jgi:hypothetical protein